VNSSEWEKTQKKKEMTVTESIHLGPYSKGTKKETNQKDYLKH